MLALRLKRAGAARTSESRRWLATASKVKAINRVRGTRDLLADDAEQHRQVLDVLQRTVNRYGFRQEMYTFEDNSGKSVTLRPEGTAGIMRALVSNNLLFSLPQKLAYSGSMFRYERPQRGRYREFQQFGVEFVGSSGPSVDAEIIAMAADALGALGIKDKVTLELNSLGDSESRTRYRAALEGHFSQYKDELSTDSINRSFLFLPEIRQTACYKNQCESLRQLSGTEAHML
ncbi:hypothetical protein BBJ29_004792 [Phytophthora kernoviae]|uniref:histidine--tRNA ligase n=1 Tax=Phytophthora kernoviae TaxID=325452 RepID=A0A3F2S0S3_9STRA|nr:hypothetical protein BBJ29_004792 [Phytophthora kernoviae]RLN68094.1 hypothetical protein BBP00_00001227 [Phytophthora kernoviae]